VADFAVAAWTVSQCAACPADTESVAGSAICVCRAGYSGPDGGPCVKCPVNSVATSDGATECGPCAAGFLENRLKLCVPCPANTFKSHTGTLPCTDIPRTLATTKPNWLDYEGNSITGYANWLDFDGNYFGNTGYITFYATSYKLWLSNTSGVHWTDTEGDRCSDSLYGPYLGYNQSNGDMCGWHGEPSVVHCCSCRSLHSLSHGTSKRDSVADFAVAAWTVSQCAACPADTESVAGSAICVCRAGYSGPAGGPCVATSPIQLICEDPEYDTQEIRILMNIVDNKALTLTEKTEKAGQFETHWEIKRINEGSLFEISTECRELRNYLKDFVYAANIAAANTKSAGTHYHTRHKTTTYAALLSIGVLLLAVSVGKILNPPKGAAAYNPITCV